MTDTTIAIQSGVTPSDRRTGERWADWHTPQDCVKLLDMQTRMDTVDKRLRETYTQLTNVESVMATNHKQVSDDISALQRAVIQQHQDDLEIRERLKSSVDGNSEALAELLEIVTAGKGFFRVVGAIGKWVRRIVLFVLPVATAIMSFWYAIKPPGAVK